MIPDCTQHAEMSEVNSRTIIFVRRKVKKDLLLAFFDFELLRFFEETQNSEQFDAKITTV